MDISNNKIYHNGIIGLAVYTANKFLIYENEIYDNGQVSKELPENRNDSAGLTLGSHASAILFNNTVRCSTHSSSSDPNEILTEDITYFIGKSTALNIELSGDNVSCGGRINYGRNEYVNLIESFDEEEYCL